MNKTACAALILLFLLSGAAGAAEKPIVNDVTQLNPIPVEAVLTPHTTDEVSRIVATHPGPISIGGGRFSMGGQIATDNTLFLDMREMNQILDFNPERKQITVQAGTAWKKIQETVDKANLSVKIMQTYRNFTVGGSLSVNVHGRYIGGGPLISSVRAFKIVLADGSIVTASRTQNPDIFFGAIGGYGGLGVITEVTLDLADNVKVERHVEKMPITAYKDYFFNHVRNSNGVIFHNGDIYPPAYDTVNAVTWSETDKPLTDQSRFRPLAESYARDLFFYNWITEWPVGYWLREHVLDPYVYRDDAVIWRNNEASYDVKELEPRDRRGATYVLEEFFVPVERFDDFVPKMREILQRHKVHMVNISIRHARQDDGAVMAWARQEVFAFVMYYRQETSDDARAEVGKWTRELIDAAILFGGRYYLPYQPWATQQQFHAAYPDANKFFVLKQKYDPQNKFRNKLWDKYYVTDKEERDLRQRAETTMDYARPESQTFWTVPEWYIVFSPDEYAAALVHRPSDFPYWQTIKQYWDIKRHVIDEVSAHYPPNPGYKTMINVIGVSYAAELMVKGGYENTIGRLTEWISGRRELQPSMKVESFMQEVAYDYVDFIRANGWYKYPFFAQFKKLWQINESPETNKIRSVERRLFFSAELLFKTGYGKLIGWLTETNYDPDLPTTWARVTVNGHDELRQFPRYQAFTDAARELARQHGNFVDIAGNRTILMTVVAQDGWKPSPSAEFFYSWPILTAPGYNRVALKLPVDKLADFLTNIEGDDAVMVDHIFDY